MPQVCDWCKHVRHTKEYLDFGSGEERLQFCSTKCLNQYKMDVFYREARAALTTSSPSRPGPEGRSEGVAAGQKLLTPESWNNGGGTMGEVNRKNVSPKAAQESSEPMPKVHISGMRPTDRSLQLHPPSTPPHPAHVPPPAPPPLPPQIPVPFIRPPLHAQGLKSPLTRHPPAPSSPSHRPAHSPHLQPPTSCSINPPGMMHPFPGSYFPGLHSPPLGMMPRGPIPMPPMMNFALPSFSPLLPQPTVLVPYPIIVPLPVPIPIPIPVPVPVPSKEAETPSHAGVIQPVPDGADRCRIRTIRPLSPGIPESESGFSKLPGPAVQGQGHSFPGDQSSRDWIKSERSFLTPHSGDSSPRSHQDTLTPAESESLQDHKHQQSERQQVIQRVAPRTQEQQGSSAAAVDLSGLCESGTPLGSRTGLHDVIRPVLAHPQSPSFDPTHHRQERQDLHAPVPHQSPTRKGQPHTSANLAPQDLNQIRASSPSASVGHDSSCLQRVPAPSSDPALSELEAKENKCSALGPAGGEGPPGPSEEPPAVVGDVGQDPHVPDEDHAYALPTAPKTGGSAAPLLLPKLRDKGSLRSGAIPSAGDLEPALKRRCLRIRDQNK